MGHQNSRTSLMYRVFIRITNPPIGIKRGQNAIGRFCIYCGTFKMDETFQLHLNFPEPRHTTQPKCSRCLNGINNQSSRVSYLYKASIFVTNTEITRRWKLGENPIGYFCPYCGYFVLDDNTQSILGKNLDHFIDVGSDIELYRYYRDQAKAMLTNLENNGITIKDIKPPKYKAK